MSLYNITGADCDKVSESILLTIKKLLKPRHNTVSKREWQFMFADVYKVCSAKSGKEIPTLRKHITELLLDHINELYDIVTNSPRMELLRSYKTAFAEFYQALIYIDTGCAEINKRNKCQNRRIQYTLEEEEREPTMLEVGMEHWMTRIYETTKRALFEELCQVIKKDRDGEVSDVATAKEVIESYIKQVVKLEVSDCARFAVYKRDFEGPFLEQTREYYQREASIFVQSTTCSEYLERIESRLKEEVRRAQRVLHSVSEGVTYDVVQEVLVMDHADMIEAEFKNVFLPEVVVPSLQHCYSLIRGGRRQTLLAITQEHIIAKGVQKLSALDTTDTSALPGEYVNCVSQLYLQYKQLIGDAFANDVDFVAMLDAACRIIVNSHPRNLKAIHASELLAKYCDSLLKKSSKLGGDGEIDGILSVLVNIFRYVDDKDVFQKNYSKLLAKRLIHNTSLSEEAEELMISKLKQCCGYEYTSKLQQMFTDMRLSSALNSKFGQTEVGGVAVGNGFKVLVLQSGAWPLGMGATSPLQLPPAQEQCLRHFEVFYESQHSGRKLNWLHHLSTAELMFRGAKQKYEFTVTAPQMAVLLLYNLADTDASASDTLSSDTPSTATAGSAPVSLVVGNIAAKTGLSKKEIDRTLRSLVLAKVLKVSGCGASLCSSGDIACSTRLVLNCDYSNKKRRVKLTGAIQRETPQDAKKLQEAVLDDRKHFLLAAIVRVMKSRKVLQYNCLIDSTIHLANARFKPSIVSIKRCIEELIDKQFLQRSVDNKQELHYVA
eukprot:m.1043233 g.1043233  ORF g.1043233 m.1043233 type:complete len:776 (-) comp24167_c0_seq5:2631-4958(-)